MGKTIETIDNFAKIIYDMLKSDRDVNMAVGGFTGEGKSTFMTKLQKRYAQLSGTYWGFDRMTWDRNELMKWIDGKKKTEANTKTGLKPGQLSEYSAILCDELFKMFYRRNWYDESQIDSIATFNMCRDRHLFIGGNVPDFWDLDTAFTSRVRFYAYIPFRGIAWVFEQENNPFSTDRWNALENKRLFRKKGNPYSIPNFLMEIHFDDWDAEEKEQYYKIRNEKRISAIDQNKSEKKERYSNIKEQRDKLIRMVKHMEIKCPTCKKNVKAKYSDKEIADSVGLSESLINLVVSA